MKSLATGQKGMVSSAHPLATQVGIDILREGGNAFDAAVSIAAALNVVEPMMSGIGGYGTTLIYDASQRECRFLNSGGRIPYQVDSDLFRHPSPDYEAARHGPKAISTPANLRAWWALSEDYGCLSWDKLLKPAIKLAEEGFSISSDLSSRLQKAFPSFPTHAQKIYGRFNQPLQTGDTLIQADLGQSLLAIANEGPDIFYGGQLGQQIIEAIQQSGGFLSVKDLLDCEAEWWDPISISYRGHQVFTASPPATSFPALIRLGLMSQFDVQGLKHNSTPFLHRFAEVTKHAYLCRLQYAADPDIGEVPLDRLLSPDYWQSVMSQIDIEHAQPFKSLDSDHEMNQHTTHFVVADEAGNIVSATQTIGELFGSRIMVPETGIWLNNSLQYCTFEPKGNPMDAHAGRHKLSGDCPLIIFKNGRPWAALGTPGGHTIAQTMPQIVMNLIDFGMDMQTAVSQPRVSFVEPNQLSVEPTLSATVRSELAAMGHETAVSPTRIGNAHGLTIAYDTQGKPTKFTGGADIRGDGTALGL